MLVFFLCINPIYSRILFEWAIKLWALRRNKCKRVHYWKKQKKHSEKTLSYSSLEPLKIIIVFAHDTIQWLNYVIHYLNMKIKGTCVEIIDLKLCISLKWDGVYKKGMSWAGPRLYMYVIFLFKYTTILNLGLCTMDV